MIKVNKSFGERLKILREKKGITQEKLAMDLDIPASTIRRYESNSGVPRKERINQIADYFDESTDYLLGRTSKAKRNENISENKTVEIIQAVADKYGVDLTNDPKGREILEDLIKMIAKHRSDGNA
ncbi:helix-turn-helix domain-containing protein [Paenibacillus chitinolyticus]